MVVVGTHGAETQVHKSVNPPGYEHGHELSQLLVKMIDPLGSRHQVHPPVQPGAAVVVVVVLQSHVVVVVEVVVVEVVQGVS